MKKPDVLHFSPNRSRLAAHGPVQAPRQSHGYPTRGKEGSLYVKAGGRVVKVTPQALQKYFREYGLDDGEPAHAEVSIWHLAQELEVALQSAPKSIGVSGRMLQFQSPSLNFRMVGSKVVNIRINLKYYDGAAVDEGVDEPVDVELE